MDFIESLYQIDLYLFWLINTYRSPALNTFFAAFTHLGSGWVAVPVTALVVILKIPRSNMSHGLILIGIAMTTSGLCNTAVKHTVRRPRPIKYLHEIRQAKLETGADLPDTPGKHALIPYTIGPRWKYRSFPSGHTNTAFAAATILYLLFGGVWILSYAAAVLVAYSRVYVGVHFPLDTIAAAVLAIVVVMAVHDLYSRRVADINKQPAE